MPYPQAIGPYSVYRRAGELLFASGQIPINPATGQIDARDLAGQAEQVFANIQGILAENSLAFSHIIKTTCFLADIADFAAFNEIYARHFSPPYPARSAFAVKDLPKGALIEVEFIASFK